MLGTADSCSQGFPLHTRDNFPARRAFPANGTARYPRVQETTETTSGMISPAFRIMTREPMNIFFRDEILVVQRRAADRRTGLRTPAQTRRSASKHPCALQQLLCQERRLFFLGGYLYASAQRGNFAVLPSASR